MTTQFKGPIPNFINSSKQFNMQSSTVKLTNLCLSRKLTDNSQPSRKPSAVTLVMNEAPIHQNLPQDIDQLISLKCSFPQI